MSLIKSRYSAEDLQEFADYMELIQDKIGVKMSARGWAYILEGERLINKDQFDRVATLINRCRKEGYLPVDFVAEETARQFHGVEEIADYSVYEYFVNWLEKSMRAANMYDLDWWEGEKYYIQCIVEKIDLVTLFEPVCRQYHIPIANSKGWSSVLQRAEYARRFKEAEDKGLQCVLLYCGDHDPDGLRISEHLYYNLYDLIDIEWSDGQSGYDPVDLIIDRFGLNYDFIKQHNLTWIDNLITGSKKNLASSTHKNHNMHYVQNYLRRYGARKCEANAIVTIPKIAAQLVRDAIESYLGKDALNRFEVKRENIQDEFNDFLEITGAAEQLSKIINKAKRWE